MKELKEVFLAKLVFSQQIINRRQNHLSDAKTGQQIHNKTNRTNRTTHSAQVFSPDAVDQLCI